MGMKIVFEGPTINAVAADAFAFATKVLETHTVAVSPKNPTRVPEPLVSETAVTSEKRRPGRPPNPLSKKGKHLAAAKTAMGRPTVQKIEKAVEDFDDPFSPAQSNLVGAAGIEPVEEETPQAPDDTFNEPETVTKAMLVEILQKICEKEDSSAGNKVAGITKVREIFSRFGVAKLGELDEKRYPEMYSYVQNLPL